MTVTPTKGPHIDAAIVHAAPTDADGMAAELSVLLPLLGERHSVFLNDEDAVMIACELLEQEMMGEPYEETFDHSNTGQLIHATIYPGACLHVARALLNAVSEHRWKRSIEP